MKKIYLSTFAIALLIGTGLASQVHAESKGGDDRKEGYNEVGLKFGVEAGMGMGKMMSDDNDGQRGVYGAVTAINGNTLTVTDKMSNISYSVDATNAKIDKNRVAISISGVTVGDMVLVEGTKNGTSVVATSIHDGVMVKGGEGMMGNFKPRIFGTVTAVSGNTITVTSKGFGPNATSITYTVDATNAKIEKAGVAGSISSILVGDSISVEGTINGTAVVATSIKDGKGKSGDQNTILEGNGQPIVGGVVTAVSGSTITIKNKSNIIYTIDTTNAKINKAGKAITTSDVVVGDTILAQGTINGTSVIAVSIIDQSNTTNNKNGDNGNHRGFFRRMGDFFSHMFGF